MSISKLSDEKFDKLMNLLLIGRIQSYNDLYNVLKDLRNKITNESSMPSSPSEFKASSTSTIDQFEKILDKEQSKSENERKNRNLIDSFNAEFLPGRIVLLEIRNQKHFGFILSSRTIAYIDTKGQLRGYLTYPDKWVMGCDDKSPYKIKKILVPTTSHYLLTDYEKMPVAWSSEKERIPVRKTVSEIEKELGLDPGTLEIY